MYNKTIWNSGDIITQEKWDNINNNLSIVGAYQLPTTEESDNTIINKSYEEIISLLKQGIICYIIYNNYIFYITEYDDMVKTIIAFNDNLETNWIFYIENNYMIYHHQVA